jgi:hypothetical protein
MPEITLTGAHGVAWSVTIRPRTPDELATVALWVFDVDDGDEQGRWLLRVRHLDESRWPSGAGRPGKRGPLDTHEVSVVALATEDEITEHRLPVPGWQGRPLPGMTEQFAAPDDSAARAVALVIAQALVDEASPADNDFRASWRRIVSESAQVSLVAGGRARGPFFKR